MERLLVVSDIHGCYNQFIQLLQKAKLTKEDRLIVLGDFIDRGPDSKKMIDILIKIQELFPKTIVLRGNHEDLLLEYLKGRLSHHIFLFNGGNTTIKSYLGDYNAGMLKRPFIEDFPKEHYKFLNDLPYRYETEEYLFVHAGLRPNIPLEKQTEEDMTWIRGEFLYSFHDFGKKVIHGHSANEYGPEIRENRINLDTAGVFGGKFTMCDVTNAIFYEVDGYKRR